MANYVQNYIVIRGRKSDVLAFINLGLKGKSIAEQTDINEAFHLLETAKYLRLTDEASWDTEEDSRPTIGLFRPLPDTFRNIDTTNAPSSFDWKTMKDLSEEETKAKKEKWEQEAKYQKETYGVVGWYDYNKQIRLGCKTDCFIEDLEIKIDGEDVALRFETDSPWSMPEEWLFFIKQTFPDLQIAGCSFEDSDEFNTYYEVTEQGIDTIESFRWEDIESKCVEADHNSEEYYNEYDSIREKMQEKLIVRMIKEFAN